jgi:hypothetical protein
LIPLPTRPLSWGCPGAPSQIHLISIQKRYLVFKGFQGF